MPVADLVDRDAERQAIIDLAWSGTNARLVAFDEFQDVLAGGNADAVIRSQIQHHGEAASCIFAHVGMMKQLFADKAPSLLTQAKPIALPPLDPLELGEFITDRFATTGKDIGVAFGWLLDTAVGHLP